MDKKTRDDYVATMEDLRKVISDHTKQLTDWVSADKLHLAAETEGGTAYREIKLRIRDVERQQATNSLINNLSLAVTALLAEVSVTK